MLRTIITGLFGSADGVLGVLKLGPIGLLESSTGLAALSLLGPLDDPSMNSAFRFPRLELELGNDVVGVLLAGVLV